MWIARHGALSTALLFFISACQRPQVQGKEAGVAQGSDEGGLPVSSQLGNDVPAPSDAGADPAPPSGELEAPYPRGAWRLASLTELQSVALWMSHILIRHRDVRTRGVSFCHAGWNSMPSPPSRTRLDALALARRVAEQARRDPGAFAELARRYSEDITNKDRGGSFGGVTAAYLAQWSQVLDALAVVQPGEASDVVETEYGFHVFYRHPVPQKQRVSGSHVVIGHDQAEFLEMLRGADVFSRSRDEASTLARQVRALAAGHPERFGQLVTEYSEHPDVLVGGDLGEWSTWEPTDYPTQVSVLSELAVGEVSEPVETLFGWEILQRTANRERELYAMTPVEIHFSVGTSVADQQTMAHERATALAELLRKEPERFEELQRQGCCSYTAQWPEGRGWPPLMAVLRRLEPGQIAAAAVDLGMSYVIPKRVPAKAAPPVNARFDLPAPSEPDLQNLFTSSDGDFLTSELRAIAGEARTELALTADRSTRLEQLHEHAIGSTITGSAERRNAFDKFQQDTQQLLAERTYSRYLALTRRHFKELILKRPAGER